ncbi:nucleotidyltransferase family protein [Parafrankia elaeagni]|uniref:nucleotidyltransferase family protein n=1 Tax=Parafrankia elaeagni TaxID=222534 RepID=UPI001E49D72F|nr:nucleotidyltransferase family protein [Parafrankia elaeagni]
MRLILDMSHARGSAWPPERPDLSRSAVAVSGGDNGDVTVDLRDSRIAEVCRRYGVAELSVFGSVARGDDTDSSDVDLLYVLAPDSTLGFEIVDLRDDLEKIVGRHVDLVAKSRLKWVIRDRVLAEARVLYAA